MHLYLKTTWISLIGLTLLLSAPVAFTQDSEPDMKQLSPPIAHSFSDQGIPSLFGGY